MKINNFKFLAISLCCVFLASFSAWQLGGSVLAEVSGDSPDNSPTTSRIKTIYDHLKDDLAYGSDAAGDWGDWGAYWNRIRSASEWAPPSGLSADEVKDGETFYSGSREAQTGSASMISLANMYNGTGTGTGDCVNTSGLNCYTQALGGVDDYNGGSSMPADSYSATWTACDEANQYCGTNSTVAEARDENSGLVWSPMIYAGDGSNHWFWAHNCKYPNGLAGSDGVCNSNGEVACQCVKHTGAGGDTKTGCEAYDDGGWRLPTQKELMLAYIDGAAGGLTEPRRVYWSATTPSGYSVYAYFVHLSSGNADGGGKPIAGGSVRCVR
ncbi:MAG TPA: DUF1566 domain-containing protein [Candidatus Woesebacteria bacterium]|nr:DUF1566 domain-containing protein [Candidatus Woesebacteria bacterium]